MRATGVLLRWWLRMRAMPRDHAQRDMPILVRLRPSRLRVTPPARDRRSMQLENEFPGRVVSGVQGRRASFNSIPCDARYLRGYLSLSLYLNSIHSATTLLTSLSRTSLCGECAGARPCARERVACLLSLFSQAYTRLLFFFFFTLGRPSCKSPGTPCVGRGRCS